MKAYTFKCDAHVTVEADSEDEAMQKLSTAIYTQDEDVDYCGAKVFVPYPGDGAELVDVYDYDDD